MVRLNAAPAAAGPRPTEPRDRVGRPLHCLKAAHSGASGPWPADGRMEVRGAGPARRWLGAELRRVRAPWPRSGFRVDLRCASLPRAGRSVRHAAAMLADVRWCAPTTLVRPAPHAEAHPRNLVRPGRGFRVDGPPRLTRKRPSSPRRAVPVRGRFSFVLERGRRRCAAGRVRPDRAFGARLPGRPTPEEW